MSQNPQTIESVFQGRRLLSLENAHLSRERERLVERFCERISAFHGNRRIDAPRYGLSSEVALRTPVLLYDLPELVKEVPTAFTDGFRVFISVNLMNQLLENHNAGGLDLDFVLAHELEHIRLKHLSRMQMFDDKTANIATDTRIDIDVLENMTNCRMFFEARSENELDGLKDNFLENHNKTLEKFIPGFLKRFYGTSLEDREKWNDATSEQIARTMMAEKKPELPIDMKELFKKAAEDMRKAADEARKKEKGSKDENAEPANKGNEASSSAPDQDAPGDQGPSQDDPGAMGSQGEDEEAASQAQAPSQGSGSPQPSGASQGAGSGSPQPSGMSSADFEDLADALDRAANGKASKVDFEKIRDGMDQASASGEMGEMDAQHETLHPGAAQAPGSLDDIKPSDRARFSAEAAKGMLNPQQGNSDSVSYSPGQSGRDDSDTHYMSPEALDEIFKRANAHNLSKTLGYDTPEKIEKMRQDTQSNIEQAVRNAAEEMARNRSYPGPHMVNHAMRDLNEFRKPVLSVKKMIEKVFSMNIGKRKTAYDIMTPSIVSSVSPGEMGFRSSGDIPYMGSHIPVKPKKNLVMCIIDTSGSTGDILHRLVGDAMQLAKKNRHDTAPEVIMTFADTVVRGKPILINEKSVHSLLRSGVTAAGLGGTDFLAPLIGACKATEKGGSFAGRHLSHILYFTDGECPLPKREHLPKNLPPVMFLVPDSRYYKRFEDAVNASGWATVTYFGEDEVTELDLETSARKTMRP